MTEAYKPLVVFADGSDHIRQSHKPFLERNGFRVKLAANSDELLFLARNHDVDLISTGLTLEGIGGVEACKRLRADPKTQDILFVLLTGKLIDKKERATYKETFDAIEERQPQIPVSLSPWLKTIKRLTGVSNST